jgi:Molecular chaperone GrpE (heat shock protein)
MGRVPNENTPANQVTEGTQRGNLLKGRVVRAARVKVPSGKGKSPQKKNRKKKKQPPKIKKQRKNVKGKLN